MPFFSVLWMGRATSSAEARQAKAEAKPIALLSKLRQLFEFASLGDVMGIAALHPYYGLLTSFFALSSTAGLWLHSASPSVEHASLPFQFLLRAAARVSTAWEICQEAEGGFCSASIYGVLNEGMVIVRTQISLECKFRQLTAPDLQNRLLR
jgi:hypothetical protein